MKQSLRLVLGLAVLGAMALGSALTATSSQAAEELKVRLDWLPWALHSTMHLAEAKGWYAAEGIKVDVEDGRGSVKTVQLVGAGNYHVGYAGQSTMAAGKAKSGIPVKAIAGIVRQNEMGILVPKDSGWTTPKDLVDNNVKVSVSAGSFEAPFLEAFFRLGGTDVKKVNFLTVGAPAQKISNYISGEAGALISGPAYLAPILATKRPSNAIMMSDFGLNMPGTGFIANDDAIANNGDAIRKFLKATLAALDYIYKSDANKKEAVAAMIAARSKAKLNAEISLAQFGTYQPLLHTPRTAGKPWGYQPPEDWREAIDNMMKAGAIPKGQNYKDYFTNALLPTVTN